MSWRCGTCGAWLFDPLPDEHDFVVALPDVEPTPTADDIEAVTGEPYEALRGNEPRTGLE
jgi:hypothetical protein